MLLLASLLLGSIVNSALPAHGEDKPSDNSPASADAPSTAVSHPSLEGVVPYQPQGATATPKVEAHWDRYHDHAAASKLLQQLAKAFPERARLSILGKSFGGREMWVLTITNFRKGNDADKPAFWIDGGIHANEIQASEVVLYTAWYLLEMYDRVPFVRQLVDDRTFYLMSMMSPDSRDAHMYRPNSTHSPRPGQRPVGDDREGAVRDDPRDDLDKDGNLTEMRVRDPNGRYKPDPGFPEMMVPAKPDEKGDYTLLGQERYDRPGEGKVYRARRDYYDPNRDWGWHWEPDYVQSGAYRYPFSVLENRMVADFIIDHLNIAGAQSYHNSGGMILCGPGVKGDSYESADLEVFDAIGHRGEKMLPGYKYMNVAKDLYECYGCEIDWLYKLRGVFALTNELFTPFNFYRRASSEDTFSGGDDKLHEFNRDLLMRDGIVPWHEVEHPLYGWIEVGGLKKNWLRQPPSFLLEEECHRNMAFSLYHADQLPLVKVQKIEVKPLAGGLSQVTAVISNERMIPTHSAADVANKITPPDLVTLSGPKLKVLAALNATDQFFENAKEQKRRPSAIRLDTIPSMGAMYVRWIVGGAGPFTVKVQSYKGGSDERSRP
ncbi:MAG TPA: M14 family metallopeptidase [Pirellulales bacterium]|nr:M14 family metallopeptidase [Pirellulales bacterium]